MVLLSHFKHLMDHTSTSEPLRQCAMRVFALLHA